MVLLTAISAYYMSFSPRFPGWGTRNTLDLFISHNQPDLLMSHLTKCVGLDLQSWIILIPAITIDVAIFLHIYHAY